MNYVEIFVDFVVKNQGYSDNTATAYRRDLHQFAAWMRHHNASARWSTITAQDIDDYVQELSEQGAAAATIKQKVSAIRSLFTWFRRKKMLDVNPAQYTSTPKLAKRDPHTVELEAITATLDDEDINFVTRVQIAMLYETGMRISELMSMRWEDIDTENRQIHITGKGQKERTVCYGERTAQHLKPVKSQLVGQVFAQTTYQASRDIHFALKKHSAQKYLSPHILRHTMATEMARNGASIYAISSLLGHESIKTTEVYAHRSQAAAQQQYLQFSSAV